MKVTLNEVETKNEEEKYPVLMRASDSELVVLFWNGCCGVVIVPGGRWVTGDVYDDFCPAYNTTYWKKFEGTITLEND